MPVNSVAAPGNRIKRSRWDGQTRLILLQKTMMADGEVRETWVTSVFVPFFY